METKQSEMDFYHYSNEMISNITTLCNKLLQSVPNSNVTGPVDKILIILDRFVSYLKLSNTSELDKSSLITINILDVVSSGLKSANSATYKKGERLSLRILNSEKRNEESEQMTIEIPHCLPIMKQALFQIIDNAVKYSPDSSELQINVNSHLCGNSSRTAITFTNIGPKVYQYELEDKECDIFCKSIRGENAERLKPQSGLGLGLTLVNMIVSCHKWIDANVFAESGAVEFNLNGIEYAPFSITLEFNNDCSEINDVTSEINKLQKIGEKMSKHEMAGSMPELTRLAYEVGIQSINSSCFDDSTKRLAFELFDSIIEFIFFLNEQDVAGRPIEIRNMGVADKILDRFVRWAFIYIKEVKPPQNLWERMDPFAPLPLLSSYIVAAWMLTKKVVDNGTELLMRSCGNSYEMHSEKIYDMDDIPIHQYSRLFAESGLTISTNKNIITILKK